MILAFGRGRRVRPRFQCGLIIVKIGLQAIDGYQDLSRASIWIAAVRTWARCSQGTFSTRS